MFKTLLLVFFPLVVAPELLTDPGTLLAQESKLATWSEKPEENELVANIDELYQQYDALYADLAKITDQADRLELFEKKNPSPEFAQKMLALEERHRRTNVGLMALRHVVLKASAVADPNDSRNKARLTLCVFAPPRLCVNH